MGERVDDLQRNGLRIIQDTDGFSFGVDAVLLAGFAAVRPGETVLDLGTGNGVIPLLLSARTQALHLTGLEILPASADRALRSVELNHLEKRITILQGDLREAARLFAPASFSVVTANPPYLEKEDGRHSPDDGRAIARHEICCTFLDVAKAARHVLPAGGRFYLIHRPFRMAELLTTIRQEELEPKRLRLVQPYAGQAPTMVLIQCTKGGRSGMEVEAPLVLYEAAGVYTEEAKEIYYG